MTMLQRQATMRRNHASRETVRNELRTFLFCALCLVLMSVPSILYAQDPPAETSITVAGSGVVANALRSIETFAGTGAALNYATTGTTAGVSTFCAGGSDLLLTQRPLNQAEEAQCNAAGVQFVELLIGYDAIVFITSSDNAFLTCLAPFELNTLFAPSAIAETTTWNTLNSAYPEAPLSLVVPAQNTLTFAQLDELVNGDGVRTDAQLVVDDAAVIAAVAEDANALGVVRLSAVLDGTATGVKPVEYTNTDLNTCIAPSAETLIDRSYTLGERMFVYVRATSLSKPGLTELLTAATSADAAAPLAAAGFVGLSGENAALASATLAAGTTGRTFSKEVNAFMIPPDVAGTVNIGGAAELFGYTQTLTENLQGSYPSLTLTVKLDGIPAGARKLCNGEVEIIAAYSDLTDEQKTNCSANNLLPISYTIGREAAVLVANGNSPYLACLKRDQIVNAFGAKLPEAMPTTWTQISAEMPETAMTLFTPAQGDGLADLLLIDATGKAIPHRDDTQTNADPLYRAAAVANVEGGLTYMTWADYQRVVENNQQRIQLVSVDGGAGCVAPSEATIRDGTYTLSREVRLITAQRHLATPTVQSLLWYIFSDANYRLLQDTGLVAVGFGTLPAVRDSLQTAFNEALAAAEAAAALGAAPVTDGTDGATSTEEAVSPTSTPQS